MCEFDNSAIRRQDRIFGEAQSIKLLSSGEYGFLAIAGKEGGYGIPISYVLEGNRIYFHCAPQGKKLDIISSDNRVTFCVVGKTKVLSASFITEYESVMVYGKINIVEDDAERMHALELIVRKYSPDYIDTGQKYAAKSFHRTVVLRLIIERISGKSKQIQ